MLSGVKFIPRDQLNIDLDFSSKEKIKSSIEKDKSRRRKKKSKSKYDSSGDEGTEKTKKSVKNRKKWYSSNEDSVSSSGSEVDSDENERKQLTKRKSTHKSKRKSKRYSPESYSSSASESDGKACKMERKRRSTSTKAKANDDFSDDNSGSVPHDDKECSRKEMGLDWMLKPSANPTRIPEESYDPPQEPQVEEVKKPNPRELNPYFKEDGSGYPDDVEPTKTGGDRLLASSVVGDGGASWRLKALKRAQEQAAREGKNLKEVAEERWGSLRQLTVPSASRPAPAHAHLHAIKDRKRGITEKHGSVSDDKIYQNDDKAYVERPGYFKGTPFRNPDMKAPKVNDSLSWRKRKDQSNPKGNTQLISAATSCLKNIINDGGQDASELSPRNLIESKQLNLDFMSSGANGHIEERSETTLSANQLAAKALQLRMKGKLEEAEKLLKQAELVKMKQESVSNEDSHATKGALGRYTAKDITIRQRKIEEDADLHLAQKITQNKQFSISGQADDEYDFDDGPRRKRNKRSGGPEQVRDKSSCSIGKQVLTQQERCQYCFENPNRPKHLVVSIGNFTYLMLPPSQPLVQGHCCILTLQHESATRNVDDNVWGEIRNFKKCLILMFAKQQKDVVFLETVIGLSQQRRHCLVECIPLPRDLAGDAQLYFKKAIDEAETEWSQHNAKKLIDTGKKGLRSSIPKNFPYFHVEFGLDEGFVHVIDNERDFKSSFGLNVIRGMLELPEEDMYRRRRHESFEAQRKAVATFAREWEPFDWTKQLD